MARYTVGVTTPAAAAGAAYCDLRTAATKRARILEIGAFTTAATSSSIGLIRPATIGTASTTTLGQAVDPADAAATATIGTAWSAVATIGTIYLRRTVTSANIGAGFIWTFGYGDLVVPVSSSILLWNFGAGAGSILSVYMTWDE